MLEQEPLPRHVRARALLRSRKHAEPGEAGHDVALLPRRSCEDTVGLGKQRGRIRGVGAHALEAPLEVGVRGAEQGLAVPGEQEHDAAVDRGGQQQGVPARQGRQDQMYALGQPHLPVNGRLDPIEHPANPRPGAVHGHPGPHVNRRSGLAVAHRRAGDPRAVTQQRGRLDPVDRHRSRPLCAVHDLQREARVVGLAVSEDKTALQSFFLDERKRLEELGGAHHAVAVDDKVGAGEPVIEPQSGLEPQASHPAAGVERDPEAQRIDAMGPELGQQLALAERLAYETEAPVFQVAQAAVNKLGRCR